MEQHSAPPVAGRKPAAPGILVFIAADLVVFAMLFTGFMADRSQSLTLFDRSSAALDVRLGILNTLILVTSGACMVFAVNAGRGDDAQKARRWILAAFAIGAGFGVSKLVEYSEKLAHGITMQTNAFFMYYYALTGAHFLHFLGGMGALAFLWFRSLGRPVSKVFAHQLESVGLYWHMVDLLWIFIFPLLYLTGMAWRAC